MAAASLNNMTVPVAAAGSDASSPTQGLLMPKLQYRFRVLFSGIGASDTTTELTKQVIDIARPSVTFPEIPLEVYNSRIYLAGKAEWQTIALNVRDDVSGEVTRIVGNQIQKQMDFMEQASAASGVDYKFTTIIEILDGGNGVETPGILEVWELYGCFIQNANYNNLNYGTNEPVTIAITMRFDNAMQANTDTGGPDYGVGAAVGRTIGNNVN